MADGSIKTSKWEDNGALREQELANQRPSAKQREKNKEILQDGSQSLFVTNLEVTSHHFIYTLFAKSSH